MQTAMAPPNPFPEEHERELPVGLEADLVRMIPWFLSTWLVFVPDDLVIPFRLVIVKVTVIIAGTTPSLILSAKVLSAIIHSDHPALATSRVPLLPRVMACRISHLALLLSSLRHPIHI
jgi:hypothetical protein